MECHVGKPPTGLHKPAAQEAKQEEDADQAVACVSNEPSVEGETLMGQLHPRNLVVPEDEYWYWRVQ